MLLICDGPHLNRLVRRDRAACARLRSVHNAGGHVLALYNGVALPAEAGLLNGRSAVVPWPFIPSVLRHAPGMNLAAGQAWVEDQRLWTADSPSQTTDLILRVLHARGLVEMAAAVRSVLLHAPERQSLAKALAQNRVRKGPGALELALRWLEDHLGQPYSLSDTASAASVSTRALLRHFKSAYNMTPLNKLHEMRVTHARMLLETTHLTIQQIAEDCGWSDVAMLRRIFFRATQLTPTAYREKFRLVTVRLKWGRDLVR